MKSTEPTHLTKCFCLHCLTLCAFPNVWHRLDGALHCGKQRLMERYPIKPTSCSCCKHPHTTFTHYLHLNLTCHPPTLLSILSLMHFYHYPLHHLQSHYLKPHIFLSLTMNAPSTPQAEGTCSLSWTVPCRMWLTCACWWRRQRSRQCAGPSWKRGAASALLSASFSPLWWGDRDGGVVKGIQGKYWLSDSFHCT